MIISSPNESFKFMNLHILIRWLIVCYFNICLAFSCLFFKGLDTKFGSSIRNLDQSVIRGLGDLQSADYGLIRISDDPRIKFSSEIP